MTKKDLFDGLNHIDEKIIEEAADPVRTEKNRHINLKKIAISAAAIAAILTVSILGTEVVRLGNRVNELESAKSDAGENTQKSNNAYAGVKSGDKLGEYILASNYEDLYDTVKSAQKKDKEMIEYDSVEITGVADDMAPSSGDVIEDAVLSEEDVSDYSTTNVMTEGVDESDVVKTDGKYIYMVEDGQISITDITDGKPKEEQILRPDFEAPSDSIEELYVNDGNMVIITNHLNDEENDETICYSYDITDPLKPQLIGRSSQDGYYSTSRKIGNIVYVFSNTSIQMPELMVKKAALNPNNLDKWVPKVDGEIINYDCIYIEDETNSGTVITSFNVDDPSTVIDTKCIMNGNDHVYVSNNAMYFYSMDWKRNRQITTISKMSFTDGIMETGESTSVSGYLNDKFAINEINGYLYVLATDSDKETEVNSLHVFDGEMKETGVLNEIARGELVYAARFVGNYVYFITYKQTDPLFVADISDPSDPKLLGELEVSGFSEYLHIWDDTHVLGIGYGDSDRKTIKLTMFDVSDPAHPVEENQKIFDHEGYYCEAMNNYKAVLVEPQKNLIGFAVDKYYLFSYDSGKGFELIEDASLKFENERGYRGIYKDDDFYVAGNGEINYFKLTGKKS